MILKSDADKPSEDFARKTYLFYKRLLERAIRGEDMTLVLVTGYERARPSGSAMLYRGDTSEPASLVGAKFVLKGSEVIDAVTPVPLAPLEAEAPGRTGDEAPMPGDEMELELTDLKKAIVEAILRREPAGPTGLGSVIAGVTAPDGGERPGATAVAHNAGSTVTMGVRGGRAEIYMERLRREPEAVIFGGGHVSRALCPLMKTLGFKVTVVDDRPEFASRTWFPDADRLVCESLDEALRDIDLGNRSYVMIMTRGHRYDQECLEVVLKKPAAYIGMIGSKTKVQGALSLAKERGFTDDDLKRIYAPIGIDIGAQTPQEIAVSIAAEVIKIMRGGTARSLSDDRRLAPVPVPHGAGASGTAGVWPDILEDFACPFAMASVISTEGSVPRQPGARMLVLPDGTIRGTIGGGCGEALVKEAAFRVIASGRPEVVRVDLTGHYKEAFGEPQGKDQRRTPSPKERGDTQGVCGGFMRVFVEKLDPGYGETGSPER